MSAFIILWKSKPRVGHTTAEDYVAPAPQPPDHDREVLSDSANARDSCLVPSTGASESYGETPTSGGNEQKEPPASQQVDSVMVTVTQLLAAQRRKTPHDGGTSASNGRPNGCPSTQVQW